jgi:hypothetical protein
MPISANETRRLGFIRYLFDVGIEQSRRPEPLSSVALLTFHDAIELFLQLVAEHHNAETDRATRFLDYWERLGRTGIALTQLGAMRRLNDARVNLKHRGILSARQDIEGFRESVASFLRENVRIALDADFDQISLATLISSDDVRKSIEEAESALGLHPVWMTPA